MKSNGFKYGDGNAEGWGTSGAKGRRLGKGQGARDVMARKKLRERLEKQRSEAASGEGVAEDGVVNGKKRKRVGGGGAAAAAGASKKGKSKEAAPSGEEAKAAAAAAAATAEGENEEEEEEEAAVEREEDTRTDEERYTCETCGVKCGSRANFENHCNSKKHKAAKQREKGKAILAALKAGR